MKTIHFFEEEHQDAERYLNSLEYSERSTEYSTDSVICYIGWTHKGEEVKVLIHD
jgi:hypothetical protein